MRMPLKRTGFLLGQTVFLVLGLVSTGTGLGELLSRPGGLATVLTVLGLAILVDCWRTRAGLVPGRAFVEVSDATLCLRYPGVLARDHCFERTDLLAAATLRGQVQGRSRGIAQLAPYPQVANVLITFKEPQVLRLRSPVRASDHWRRMPSHDLLREDQAVRGLVLCARDPRELLRTLADEPTQAS